MILPFKMGFVVLGVFSITLLIAYFIKSKVFDFLILYARNSYIGAVAPSSSHLTRELVKNLDRARSPYRILEVGAGTGAVTEKIIQSLKPGDILDVIEIEPYFYEILSKKFGGHPQVYLHCTSITKWDSALPYDLVVSTIPLYILSYEVIENMLIKFNKICSVDGSFSFIKYLGCSNARKFFLWGRKHHEAALVENLIDTFFETSWDLKDSKIIMQNLPPARVLHFQRALIK